MLKITADSVIEVPVVNFRFGKYSGNDVFTCEDTDYMCWYCRCLGDKIADNEFKKSEMKDVENEIYSIAAELNCRGAIVNIERDTNKKIHVSYVTPTMVSINAKKAEYAKHIIDAILSKGANIEVEFKHNINYNGDYEVYAKDIEGNVIYHFDNAKYIRGRYPTTLPVINGKSKRINGASFVIHDYTWTTDGDKVIINVKDMTEAGLFKKNKEKAINKAKKEEERLAKKAMKEAEKEARAKARAEAKAIKAAKKTKNS